VRIGVDIGGTFTDLVALDRGGTVRVTKVRTTPDDPARGLWQAVAELGPGVREAAASLVHGTTVATNALLERRGGRVALVATAGFEDLLWLRRQDRAALYDLARDHPRPLVEREAVVGVVERVGAVGVVTPLVDSEIARVVAAVARLAPDAVCVALLFSFAHPDHERRLAAALRTRLGTCPVVASHEILPVFREYERTSTATMEAYLRPLVSRYLERVGSEAARTGIREFRVMASNGGTLSAAQAVVRAASLALSGPAGGVEGARLAAAGVVAGDLLTLDMGGTSADASVVLAGQPLVQSAGSVGGTPLALPHVVIETVGAGGGSIAWVDNGGALRVGPRSAGAVPGPACYGLGGEDATVTDAALVLGWLDPAHPLAADLVLDQTRARRAVERVGRAAGLDVRACAEGIVEIATAAMVRALRAVSVERGLDPRGMTLVAFGGAGPLFVCRLADSLGVRRALIPPHPGALSALGLATAKGRVEFAASLHRRADALDSQSLARAFEPLERAALAELPGAAVARVAECRYPGQGYEVAVAVSDGPSETAATFHAVHESRFGYADRGRPVELVNVRVVATAPGVEPSLMTGGAMKPLTGGRAPLEELAPGAEVAGPLMLDGRDATARIEAGWRGRVHVTGAVCLERA
jgi:N-methylhydantoinase A